MINKKLLKLLSLALIIQIHTVEAMLLRRLQSGLRGLAVRVKSNIRARLQLRSKSETNKSSLAPSKPSGDVQLSPLAYRMRAQQVLKSTLALGKGLPHDYKTFLAEQSSSLEQLKNGTLDISKACRVLDPSWVALVTLNHVDRDQGARFLSRFVYANSELVALCARRILQCHTGSLDLCEWHDPEIPKVTMAEYEIRLKKLDPAHMDKLFIENSSALATAISSTIDASSTSKAASNSGARPSEHRNALMYRGMSTKAHTLAHNTKPAQTSTVHSQTMSTASCPPKLDIVHVNTVLSEIDTELTHLWDKNSELETLYSTYCYNREQLQTSWDQCIKNSKTEFKSSDDLLYTGYSAIWSRLIVLSKKHNSLNSLMYKQGWWLVASRNEQEQAALDKFNAIGNKIESYQLGLIAMKNFIESPKSL